MGPLQALITLPLARFKVAGASMEPALAPGDHVIALRLGGRPLQRGEIVVAVDPTTAAYTLKRIIGLPGERVELSEGGVFINGRRLNEPYAARQDIAPAERGGGWRTPDGHYFLMGDNRPASVDSRQEGPVPAARVAGRVWLRYFPWRTRGRVHSAESAPWLH